MTKPRTPSAVESPDAYQSLVRLKRKLEELLRKAERCPPKDRNLLALQVADLIEEMTEELLQFYQAVRLAGKSRPEDRIVIEAYERVRDVLRRWRARPSALYDTLTRALERLSKRA